MASISPLTSLSIGLPEYLQDAPFHHHRLRYQPCSPLYQDSLELQHEVLSHLHSPKEVAALSKTGRYFFHCLQDPVLQNRLKQKHFLDAPPRATYDSLCRESFNLLKERYIRHPLPGHTNSVTGIVELSSRRIAFSSEEGTLRILDLQTSEALILNGDRTRMTCMLPLCGERILTGSVDGALKVWDLAVSEKEPLTLTGHTDWVRDLLMLWDGRVTSCSKDHTIKVWNSDLSGLHITLEGHEDEVQYLATIQNELLVSASDDCTLKIWTLKPGECSLLQTILPHDNWPTSLAVLRNGRICLGVEDMLCNVLILNAKTYETDATLVGHTDEVTCIAPLFCGRFASGSADETIKIWQTDTGTLLATLQGHTSEVTHIVALDNGQILSASSNGELYLWNFGDRI